MPQILTPYTLHLILHLTSYILYHTSSPAFSIKQNHYLWFKILKTMKLLLLSNSTNPGEDYSAGHAKSWLILYGWITWNPVFLSLCRCYCQPGMITPAVYAMFSACGVARFSRFTQWLILYRRYFVSSASWLAVVILSGWFRWCTTQAWWRQSGKSESGYTLYRLERRIQCCLPKPAHHQRYAYNTAPPHFRPSILCRSR